MKKLLFPHMLLLLGLVGSGLFPQWATAQSNPDSGPIRARYNPGTAQTEGLEFIDTATGKLVRYLDFAKDGPYGDLEFTKGRKEDAYPYILCWDLKNVAGNEVLKTFGITPQAYKEFYGTEKTCFKGVRIQTLHEINGEYAVVNFRLSLFGGEGEIWKATCPHFSGIQSILCVYDKFGKLLFQKETGWDAVTDCGVTSDGHYLTINQQEISGDISLFGSTLFESSVVDLRTGATLDKKLFADDISPANNILTVQGHWVIMNIDYYGKDGKERRLKQVFFDFDKNVKYIKDNPLEDNTYDKANDEGFHWQDPKSKRVVRSILISRDLPSKRIN